MSEVAEQAVGNIDGRGRDAAQRKPQIHAWRGAVQPFAGDGQILVIQGQVALQCSQCKACIPQIAGYPELVAGACAAASQSLRERHAAEHGNAERQRPACRITADQLDGLCIGQRHQPLREGFQPCRIGSGQCQREGESQRSRTHGGEIGKIDGQRLMTQRACISARKKMPAFD